MILWWKAGCMAPVTTVAPLFLVVSLFSNMVCGPALLQEQYRSHEVHLRGHCGRSQGLPWALVVAHGGGWSLHGIQGAVKSARDTRS